MAPIFTATDIRAGYGDVVIIDGISIDVSTGETVAILGPNGSGKSTLLKSLLGFAHLMNGKVVFDGKDITAFTSDRLVSMGVGYVPQTNNVFANLTILENLEMGAYSRRDGKAVKGDIVKMFDMFPELAARKRAFAGTLSGGERQMLAIARAMMAKPRVLLLDEPLASLAPKAVDGIIAKLIAIRQSGTAMIIIEQNVKKALEFAARAYILVNGNCVMKGDSKTILADDNAKRRYLGL